MRSSKIIPDLIKLRSMAAYVLLLALVFSAIAAPARSAGPAGGIYTTRSAESGSDADVDPADESGIRVEKVQVAGGAEIITIFFRPDAPAADLQGPVADIPLLSVMRDTLGDTDRANDRLRYMWMLTYTKPTFTQRLSAFVPFLYTKTTDKRDVGDAPPPPVIDLNGNDSAIWHKVFWLILKRFLIDDRGFGLKASALQYRQNAGDYRRAALAAAMTVLSLYQDVNGERIFTDAEMREMTARLSLTNKTFGGMMQPENLGRVYNKEITETRDYRGHNWELLRQYSEHEGLYFEPLDMPDGTARHAIVWTTKSDIAANTGKDFNSRFLNIKNPWTDDRLKDWKGYTQERWFDAEGRVVEPGTAGARSESMIPLAIYGLDNPKIPMILVDFRDNRNPKFREMSKRILNDVATNVLSVSKFSSLPYFLGRFTYDFITGRRGMDLNQASRLRSYSQLKLLLSIEDGLDPDLRTNIEKRLGSATLNPLQNGVDAEADLARKQYANLMEYAKRPNGLPRTLADDRREEMVRLEHGKLKRALFSIAHSFSFGLYTHREKGTPEMFAKMDMRRQLDYHEKYLVEIASVTVDPAIDSNVTKIKESLNFIGQKGQDGQSKTVQAIAKIFAKTSDDEMRSLCLAGLYRINNRAAKKELLAIYNDQKLDIRWRNLSAKYLKLAVEEGQEISLRDTRLIAQIVAN